MTIKKIKYYNALKNKKILILGAKGFSKNLIQELKEKKSNFHTWRKMIVIY